MSAARTPSLSSGNPRLPTIEDHGLVGDSRACALISRFGTVDWLCWPRFDSPSVFAALLDPDRGGRFALAPLGLRATQQQYLDQTNVLVTRFETGSGTAELTDFMPVANEGEPQDLLLPEHELVRVLECTAGHLEVEAEISPRPDYGRAEPKIRSHGRLGFRVDTSHGSYLLRSDRPMTLARDGVLTSRFRLYPGERAHFSIGFSRDGPAVLVPFGAPTRAALARTLTTWRAWAERCTYRGRWRDDVVRSALCLKLLQYAPSGSIIAAPTTSLPERLGGELNWDYRFCWLRDAALTSRALYGIGYEREAHAFVDWLAHSTVLTLPRLRVLYDVFGEQPRPEVELPELRGFLGSRPVRVGNAAQNQHQLDIYGEVIDAVSRQVRRGKRLDRDAAGLLIELGLFICHEWRAPDLGIWEIRDDLAHHVHSKLMSWTGLDRLVRMQHEGELPDRYRDEFTFNRELLRAELEHRGYNHRLGAYARALDGELTDASLLLLSLHGFERAGSRRMRRTWRRICERLGAGEGLLFRSEHPLHRGEGAFLLCSFWAVQHLALGGGSLAEAGRMMDAALAYRSPTGLFAEEIDPTTGVALGNYPQAFSHLGVINAALTLQEREAREHPSARRFVRAPAMEANA